MIPNIGNPELEFLFEEDTFKTRKRTEKELELSKIYESAHVDMPKSGQIVQAEFIGETKTNFTFDVQGYKDYVRVDNKLSEYKYLKNSQIGDIVDVLIVNIDHNNFYIRGSISTLYENKAHETLQSLKEGESVTAYVKALNPAGYDVELSRGGVTLTGFMPNTLAGINKLYDPTSIIGETFEVMIESYADQEGTYIVSRRKYLRSLIPSVIKDLNFDNSYTGKVTGTTPFGVFVEFNECLTGMIHKANLNPAWQERISEIKPGFEIDFYVKEVIREKIILTQILRESLWDSIRSGQVLDGVVKDIKGFGCLVSLDGETIGLIHTSEIMKLNIKLTPGQEIKVKVISVDRSNRKIYLTV